MHYDPRTIAFLAEVLFPPIQLPADAVQGIHNTLFRQRELAYQSFQIAPDGIHLTNLPDSPGSVSSVTFMPDRIVVREELRATTLEDFATRLVNVTKIGLEQLKIPFSAGQQIVIRSLVTPRHVTDSREFLARRMISADETPWSHFGRPFQSAGISLMFPQHGENTEVYSVRVETWNQDPRSLWIENVGTFTQPIQRANTPELATNLTRTYRFVTGPVCSFLHEFDHA
ncbi:MAG: hypothetical protein KDC87_03700 [Planctomycetes bacterium]|nr:hypothetical protein [Planctomycetota bacterium]MCB9869805.1 hypothetical protein [Planctomycetota bacterium]